MLTFFAFLLAGAAQSAPPEFDISRIGFTQRCEPNDTFSRLLAVLVGRGGARPDDDALVRNAITGDTSHSLRLDQSVPWNGLKLRGVELRFGIERGPANYALVFDESPERAVAILNSLGLQLPASGGTRDVRGLEKYASMGVTASGSGSALWCARD